VTYSSVEKLSKALILFAEVHLAISLCQALVKAESCHAITIGYNTFISDKKSWV
jgi:hypothetical protein